jgi:hypothetical protein
MPLWGTNGSSKGRGNVSPAKFCNLGQPLWRDSQNYQLTPRSMPLDAAVRTE